MDATLIARRARLALAALAVALLAGCTPTAPDDGDDPTVAADTVVEILAFEYFYTVPNPEAGAGAIQFVLVNKGGLAHDLVLEDGPGGATSVIGPGETDDFTVTLEPGTYTLYCSVGNHRAQGMEVEITVREVKTETVR